MKLRFRLVMGVVLALCLLNVAWAQTLTNNNANITIAGGTNVTLVGSVVNNATGTVTNNGTVSVSGDWTNNGTAAVGSGLYKFSSNTPTFSGATDFTNVELNGTAQQSVTASAGTNFGTLTVNNSNGANLLTDILITSLLDVKNATVVTNLNKVSLGTTATTARTTGYVNGNIQKTFSTGAPTFNFMVGTSNGYSPANVAFDNVSVQGSLTVRADETVHPGALVPAEALSRYWSVLGDGVIGFSSFNLVMHYRSSDFAGALTEAGDENSMRGAKYDGSVWTYPFIITRFTAGAGGFFQINDITSPGYFTTVKECGTIAAPVAVDGSRCGPGSVSLGAIVGGALTVDWYDAPTGGNLLIAGTSTYITPSISGTTSYYAEAVDPLRGCTSATRTTVTATVNTSNVWTGAIDNDWFKPGNWTCGGVPNATVDASVPDVTPNPAPVVSGGTAIVKDVTIDAGSSVQIDASATVEIKGALTNNGTSNLGDGTVKFSGTSAQVINGNLAIGTLITANNSGVSLALGAGVDVKEALILEAGLFDAAAGTVTLKSDPAKTAYVKDWGGNTGTYNGNITLERYVPSGAVTSFHFIGSASGGSAIKWVDDFSNGANSYVSGDGTPVTPTSTCSPTQLNWNSAYGNLMTYDESIVTNCYVNGWRIRTVGANTSRGTGFAGIIPGGTVLDETGNYFNTPVTLNNLSNTSSNTVATAKGFHIVANPFYAPVDWNEMTTLPVNQNMDFTAYLYNPNTGTFGSYNLISGPGAIIATNQGFYVRPYPGVSTPFDVTFDPSTRTDAGLGSFQQGTQGYEYALNITVDANNKEDNTMIAFDAGFTDNYDNGYDAGKIFSDFGVPSVYTLNANSNMHSILALGIDTNTHDVPLSVRPTYTGAYTLTFNDLADFPSTVMVWLEDLSNAGQWQNLRLNNTYTFNAAIDDNADRFVLHFTPQVQLATTDANCAAVNGQIEINQPAGIIWDYQVTNSIGTVVNSATNFTGNAVVSNLTPGIYNLQFTHSSGYIATESISVGGVVAVDATATSNISIAEINQPVSFTSTVSNATQFEWNFGDGSTDQVNANPVHTYPAPGVYNVVFTAGNGDCSDNQALAITVEDNSIGITNTNSDALTLYNNGNTIFFGYNTKVAGSNALTLKIYNTIGQNIFEINTSQVSGSALKTAVLKNVADGMYIAEISAGNKKVTKRLFINQ